MPFHNTGALHRALLQPGCHTDTSSYSMKGIGQGPLDFNLTVGRKDILFMTRCFCSTALTQENNAHKPTNISIQICKGVNTRSAF